MCITVAKEITLPETDAWKAIIRTPSWTFTGPYWGKRIYFDQWMQSTIYSDGTSMHTNPGSGFCVFPRKEDALVYEEKVRRNLSIVPCKVKGLVQIGYQEIARGTFLFPQVELRVAWSVEWIRFTKGVECNSKEK